MPASDIPCISRPNWLISFLVTRHTKLMRSNGMIEYGPKLTICAGTGGIGPFKVHTSGGSDQVKCVQRLISRDQPCNARAISRPQTVLKS